MRDPNFTKYLNKVLNEEFDFENLGKCLMFISVLPERVGNVSQSDRFLARRFRDHIFLHGYIDSRLKNTLVYIQSIELLSKFK